MKLVVIIPALNEEATIASVIEGIPASIPGIDAREAVVVDDGSTDRTRELAEAAGARVVSHDRPRGVGAAFRRGLAEALRAGADVICNIDADDQFDPADIPSLVRPILDREADAVTCTRFAEKGLVPEMPWRKRAGNRMVTRIVNFVTGRKFTDVSCGFRAYSREAALRLNLFGRFTYTQESLIALAGHGLRVREVPLKVKGVREHGDSRVASSLWRYAWNAGMIILRAGRDMRPLAFFGALGLLLALPGLACEVLVSVHWLRTGMTSPYKSLITVGGVLLLAGFMLIVLALLADMLGRQRRLLEEMLYRQRKAALDRVRERRADGAPGPNRPG